MTTEELRAEIERLKADLESAASRERALREALGGLLSLCEKMWGMLEQSVAAGVARFTPRDAKFDQLTYVNKARAVLSAPQDREQKSEYPRCSYDEATDVLYISLKAYEGRAQYVEVPGGIARVLNGELVGVTIPFFRGRFEAAAREAEATATADKETV